MIAYYIVKPGGEIVKTYDVHEYDEWYNQTNDETGAIKHFSLGGRRIAWTDLKNGDAISTVFLPLDHSLGRGQPVLFETMIRRGETYEEQWRYHTLKEARAGHERAVMFARGEITEEEVQPDWEEDMGIKAPGKCAELAKESSDFFALLKKWEEDKHCPYPLADFLREYDMYEEAKAAEWAVNETLRPAFHDPTNTGIGVFPALGEYKRWWYWLLKSSLPLLFADHLLTDRIINNKAKEKGFSPNFLTCPQALCWFLDNWRESC